MSYPPVDIHDMQCWVFRMAQTKWKLSSSECAKLFKEFNIFKFIEDCYDILHLNSYACVLADVERIIEKNGVRI